MNSKPAKEKKGKNKENFMNSIKDKKGKKKN
jgi:hypothetical protein